MSTAILSNAPLRSILDQELHDRPVVADMKNIPSEVGIAELQIRRDHANIPLGTKSSSELWPQMSELDRIGFVRRKQLRPSEKSFKFSSGCATKVVSPQDRERGMIKFTGMSQGLQR